MKLWHRWALCVVAVPCIIVGLVAVYAVLFRMSDSRDQIRQFAAGLCIFTTGLVLLGIAVLED